MVNKSLSPLATISVGLQQEAKGKANEVTIDFNKVGQTVQGLNNDSNSVKPTGIIFFKTDKEATPQ
ncbi:hypothetical protein [Bacillus toyonensis]|uniref:Uncharacterized protein n=1 Tax=Bacillus toyonensis TaxID=155322 RepID=A0ABX6G4R0_9BACI|nr:hypothetical protein [Bacillus toyonensis]MED2737881.1 hypothetical protein [Bacillus toyonensis]QHA15987.1 hypothetical protein GPA05_02805 [Bacillus toyonensis]